MTAMQTRLRAQAATGGAGEVPGWLMLLALLLVLAGTLARLMPLTDLADGLYWQHMTEDGYLMQTVARNMATGLGMSTAEGTMPTNGVQPLATFAFAGLHWLAGGDRQAGIILVTVFSTLIALATAGMLWRMATLLFASLPQGRLAALLAAGLWLVAPAVFRHSVNGLETGVYHLAILAAFAGYLGMTRDPAPALGPRRSIALGVLLGIAFLARVDAVFLIAALLAAHGFLGWRDGGGMVRRLGESVLAGLVSILVASPWLIYNYRLFGSVIPISGTAQSHDAVFGANLHLIPSQMLEALAMFLPIPGHLQEMPVVAVAAALLLLAALALIARTLWPAALALRRVILASFLFAAGIGAYYGLFFGAPWFMARYLSALSPLLWPLGIAAALQILATLLPARARLAAAALLLLLPGLAGTALAFRPAPEGTARLHRQVVDWVAANVPPATWVGAVQTGTLGFFHDRTINLDGKVNPEALRLQTTGGDVRDYVTASKIDYIVDWHGVKNWLENAPPAGFAAAFELRHADPAANLSVMARRVPTPPSP